MSAHFPYSRAASLAAALALVPLASTATQRPAQPAVFGRAPLAVGNPLAGAARTRASNTDCPSKGTNAFLGGGVDNNVGGTDAGLAAGQYNGACNQLDFIGAGNSNVINNTTAQNAAEESFIGAGDSNFISSYRSGVVAGMSNVISAPFALVGAGYQNIALGAYSFAGGGAQNRAGGQGAFAGGGGTGFYYAQTGLGNTSIDYGNNSAGIDSFVGAGDLNYASGNGSFIGGGGYQFANAGNDTAGNEATGVDSFVGAGDQNVVAALDAFNGGGDINSITSPASYATIGGGSRNTITGEYGSIVGGYGNRVEGTYGMVAGGDGNVANELSFAAGYKADAVHTGSFVWSDFVSGSAALEDTANDQFLVRASGGVTLYTDETMATGVKLAAGSGTWESVSDRNAKVDIAPLDDDSILTKVDDLPVNAWRYKSESGVRHVGPMAQDFYAAFGVGEDDRHITSIDEDGVALAAIKALHRENGALHRSNETLAARVASLESQMTALLASVKHAHP